MNTKLTLTLLKVPVTAENLAARRLAGVWNNKLGKLLRRIEIGQEFSDEEQANIKFFGDPVLLCIARHKPDARTKL